MSVYRFQIRLLKSVHEYEVKLLRILLHGFPHPKQLYNRKFCHFRFPSQIFLKVSEKKKLWKGYRKIKLFSEKEEVKEGKEEEEKMKMKRRRKRKKERKKKRKKKRKKQK